MIEASCHCGAIRIGVPHLPATLTSCNCSICRRTGALWGYFKASEVEVASPPHGTQAYLWGDQRIAFVRCARCGCLTHWQAAQPADEDRVGINMRNCDPAVVAVVRVRHLDGADTWTFLD